MLAHLRCLETADVDLGFTAEGVAQEWVHAQVSISAAVDAFIGADALGGINPGDRRALYRLVRHFKPNRVLEIGTHVGASTVVLSWAMHRNQLDHGRPVNLHSVDILDVNAADGPWFAAGLNHSPLSMMQLLGFSDWVSFESADSRDFLRSTTRTFDLVFLDGSHDEDVVYQELKNLDRVLTHGATLVLHDYFPFGQPLWAGRAPIVGPWGAVQKLLAEGAPIVATPLGRLPWETKLGSNTTSLALVSARPD